MSMIDDISTLSCEDVENIEKLSLRWLVRATLDFGFEAYEIFYYSPDEVKDVAEDVTREIVERLPGYNLNQRIYGTVDYKRARYIILPDQIVRQALFIDSKAEKSCSTATLQTSQTSLEIRQIRSGKAVAEQGRLPVIYTHGQEQYLSTTLFLHYCYEDIGERHILHNITLFCVPNGILQDKYNPDPSHGFWIAGRNAPSLGEDFRVRVSFIKLKSLANWRVQSIQFHPETRMLSHMWEDRR